MPRHYASRAQQGLFNLKAKTSSAWQRLANRRNKASYTGTPGGKANKRTFRALPKRVKKHKK